MLEVVKHQQQLLAMQEEARHDRQRQLARGHHAHRLGHGGQHQVRIALWRQRVEDNPITGALPHPQGSAQTIPAGNWTIGAAFSATPVSGSLSPAYWPTAQITLVNGLTGQKRTVISRSTFLGSLHSGTDERTALSVRAAGPIVVQAGDYLAVEFGVENSGGPTINATLYATGTTPITVDNQATGSAQSFLQAPAGLTFQ